MHDGLDDLPEILLQGRERELLTWLFRAKSTRPWTITPADLAEYVRVNAAPGATRAALSYQRHNLGPEGIAHTRARAERKLAMPVLAVGAESGAGATLPDTMRLVLPFINTVTHRGRARRPPRKARGGRIPRVFDRRATPRGGMHRRPNATVFMKVST